MSLSVAAVSRMLEAFASAVDEVSLSGDGVEVDRKPVRWRNTGVSVMTDEPLVFNVPAGMTVSEVAYWAAGVPFGTRRLSAAQPFITAGTYVIPAGGLSEMVAG